MLVCHAPLDTYTHMEQNRYLKATQTQYRAVSIQMTTSDTVISPRASSPESRLPWKWHLLVTKVRSASEPVILGNLYRIVSSLVHSQQTTAGK